MPDDRLQSEEAEKKLPKPEVYIVKNGETVFKPGMKTWFVETRKKQKKKRLRESLRPNRDCSGRHSMHLRQSMHLQQSKNKENLFLPVHLLLPENRRYILLLQQSVFLCSGALRRMR